MFYNQNREQNWPKIAKDDPKLALFKSELGFLDPQNYYFQSSRMLPMYLKQQYP